MRDAGLVSGRILMLEPRRLATRAAAERMAHTLNERVGQTVGYRIRGERKTGPQTKIEVVTEGILTRMIQSDPELSGIGAVIFDEFHERSLQADLGLALSLEIRDALRPDLMLVVMSATLDAGPVQQLMGNAPVITSEGRAYPVDCRWLDKPWARPNQRGPRFEDAAADLVLRAIRETSGGILVFLPGEGEIRRVAARLGGALPVGTAVFPLFGALPFSKQRTAIAPLMAGSKITRKIVLATAIAETSLTIEDIRVVVDTGRARRAKFDAPSGMSRLVTERVSRAEATQRQGRAGRVAAGVCYKLWTKGEEGSLRAFPAAEIEAADLAPLVLETALWGAAQPRDLPFLTPPNLGGIARAKDLLMALDALDGAGRITPHGRKMAALPLHPRLAHMVLKGGVDAPLLAAILSARDFLQATAERPPSDLALRLKAAKNSAGFAANHPFTINRPALERILHEARRIKPTAGPSPNLGEMTALAYPDRVGLHRPGPAPRFVLSGGKGALFDAGDPLAGARLIVATDLDGDTREARIRLATSISEGDLRATFPDQIKLRNTCHWSHRDRIVKARQQQMFGALVLGDQHWRDCPQQQIATAMIEGIRDLGLGILPFNKAARLLIARTKWLRARGGEMPDMSETGLLEGLEHWLLPVIGNCRSPQDLKALNLTEALKTWIGWDRLQNLDRLAPAEIVAPTGTRLAVDYSRDTPAVSVRLQEMFGLTRHPTVGPDRLPLVIELLSPARRPVQTTSDLPGFWASSYQDVRKDMRGRYPRHPWPEDPTKAAATRRVKPRGT